MVEKNNNNKIEEEEEEVIFHYTGTQYTMERKIGSPMYLTQVLLNPTSPKQRENEEEEEEGK